MYSLYLEIDEERDNSESSQESWKNLTARQNLSQFFYVLESANVRIYLVRKIQEAPKFENVWSGEV